MTVPGLQVGNFPAGSVAEVLAAVQGAGVVAGNDIVQGQAIVSRDMSLLTNVMSMWHVVLALKLTHNFYGAVANVLTRNNGLKVSVAEHLESQTHLAQLLNADSFVRALATPSSDAA